MARFFDGGIAYLKDGQIRSSYNVADGLGNGSRLDVAKKTIDATEALTYRNLTGRALDTFPFHLYLNAFQPASTFMREVRLYGTRGTGPGWEWDPKYCGAIEVKSLEVVGQGDLTKEMRFIQPDDTPTFHNPDDDTVFQIRLPQPVAPGGEITFRIAFHDQLPEVLARTGYKRDFFMVAVAESARRTLMDVGFTVRCPLVRR
jgi:hypothetical protein